MDPTASIEGPPCLVGDSCHLMVQNYVRIWLWMSFLLYLKS